METQAAQVGSGTSKNQFLWFAGAVGATVGVAAWAYWRRELSYWGKTKRAAGQVAARAADVNPWLAIGAGTAVLGGAALAYRRHSAPKSLWQRASERGGELVLKAGEQLSPWWGVMASTGLSLALAAYNAKSRRR